MADPPIDTGWAWMIALGCFGMYTIIAGFLKTGGLILVEFLYKYEATKAETVWVFAIVIFLMLGIGPVGNAFAARFTVRALVITGAGISSLGFILSGYASAVRQLYITYGIFIGFGFGLTYAPSLVILSVYFKKRRALANGMAGAGSGFGGIIVPFIARYAIDEYGLKGALLILGAMMSNMVLVGALYRPLTFYRKHRRNSCSIVSESAKNSDKIDKRLSNVEVKMTKGLGDDEHKFLKDNERLMKSIRNGELESKIHIEKVPTNLFRARSHAVSVQTTCKPGDVFSNYNTSIFNGVSVSADNINIRSSSSYKTTNNSACFREERKSPSALYLNAGDFMGVSMQIITDEKDVYENTSADNNEFTNSRNRKQMWKSLICCQLTNKNEGRKMFDWSLLKKFTFILLLISGFCAAAGMPVINLIIPPHMDDLLIPKTDVAIVLGVSSCLDFIGRISMGWLADHVSVKRYVYIGCMVICGLANFILLLSPTFAAVITTGCIVGVFGGAYSSLLAVVLIEQLGIETLSHSLGITVLFQSLAPIAVNPLVGWIRDYTGSWKGGFVVTGFFVIFGGIIMLLEPWAKKFDVYLAARKRKAINTSIQ